MIAHLVNKAESRIVRAITSFFETHDLPKFILPESCLPIRPGSTRCGAQKITYIHKWIGYCVQFTIDTIPYDTGLEALFEHSLHSVYFRKFTPCCLPRLTFEPEPL